MCVGIHILGRKLQWKATDYKGHLVRTEGTRPEPATSATRTKPATSMGTGLIQQTPQSRPKPGTFIGAGPTSMAAGPHTKKQNKPQ